MKIKIIIFFLIFLFIIQSCIDDETRLYNEVKETNTVTSYQFYLEKYKNGKFCSEITDSLNYRIQDEEFSTIKSENILNSYKIFLKKYPNTKYLKEINDSIYFITENLYFDTAFKSMNLDLFKFIVDSFAEGRYVIKAQFFIDSIQIIVDEKKRQDSIAKNELNTKFGTFTDNRDGKIYKTIKIGNQIWFAENLAYLPSVTKGSVSDGYWVYDYNGSDVAAAKLNANYKTHGVLYSWEKAKTSCPSGWHLPTDAEWSKLTTYLGGESVAGGKMREKGTTHWKSPNVDASNSSLFNALPSGSRDPSNGKFDYKGKCINLWSSNTCSSSTAWMRYIYYDGDDAYRNEANKLYGFSVRCVKDN